ncbi:MAG TPA: GFA family protein [Candidatus Binataceae bacterium]|nr:GFA family protein [Candidatus Binataceae bacterium]
MRYEIEGAIVPLNCHCSMCRKVTGAAFRSRAAVPTKNFRWKSGEDLLTRYESSPGTVRTFCRLCGATLASLFAAMRTLDDDPDVRPSFHVFVGSKAPWFEITDGLPQFDAFPPTAMVRKDGFSAK